MAHDTEPPDSGDDTMPFTDEELDAIVAEQDPEYSAAWRQYVTPLRGEET